MNPNIRPRNPAILSTRKRTIDRAASNQEVVQGRKLKKLNPMEAKLPTHIGVKRFFTADSMRFIRSTVRGAIDTERNYKRMPEVEAGSKIQPVTLASNIRLDILSSRKITPDYARGLMHAIQLLGLSAEQNRVEVPTPVIATVKDIRFGDKNKNEVKMILESDELREERSRLAEYFAKNGVKAYTYVKEEDPLEVVIARTRVDFSHSESINLVSAISSSMTRLQSETETPGTVVELQPWQYTKGINSAKVI